MKIPSESNRRTRAVAFAGGAVLTALMKSLRWEVSGKEWYDQTCGAGRPAVYVLWHGRLLPCSFYHRHQRLATLISQHRDGDYISGVVEGWWGFETVRGSSSRGGSGALRQIVRLLREGRGVAITPDGPRGPSHKMKTGPLVAAQMAGVPVVPVTAGANRAWWITSWDRFLVPQPFSQIRLEYGEPLMIPRSASEADVERLAGELEERLNLMTHRVDAKA